MSDRMLSDEILLGLIKKNGGGGGGTTNYNDLSNQPQINGNTLVGDKSASDLGLVAAEAGKGLSENDFTDEDKAIVGGVTAALAGKQDTLTFDDVPTANSNNPVKSGGVYSALTDKATMLTGVTTPTQSEGEDGDVYLKLGFDSLSFKYIRFKVNAIKSGSLTQMARFKFWDSSDNALSYPTGTQVVSDPSSTGAEGVQNLITDSGKFLVTGLPTVTFTFPDDALLDLSTYIKYGWYTANDQPSRDPVSWELSASNDGTTWLSLDSVVNAEVPDTRSVLAFKGEYKQLGATKIENIYFKDGSWIKDQFAKQNEVESALALKQNATDNNLETDAKTIVGAINEHEGDIDSLKSGLTNKEPLGGTNTGNKTFYVGDKLYLKTDNEGGNIVIKSPTNIAYEADAYNGSFRFRTTKSGVGKSITWDGMSDVNLNAMPKIYHGTVTSDSVYGSIGVPNATNSLIVLVGNDVKSYHLEYNNPNVFILRDENNNPIKNTSVEIMAMYI